MRVTSCRSGEVLALPVLSGDASNVVDAFGERDGPTEEIIDMFNEQHSFYVFGGV